METRQVHAGRDTILALADRAQAVDALAELIWNALDADATTVEVTVDDGGLGAPSEIVIADNGTGIPYDEATAVFSVEGESWKKDQRFSARLKRPLHGKQGRGRFLAYTLGEQIDWSTTDQDGNTTTISGSRARPNEYDFDGPNLSAPVAGTTVRIRARQDQKVARLLDAKFPLMLTARLAPTLLALKDAAVSYRGAPIDPAARVVDETRISMDPTETGVSGTAELVIVEWDQDLRSRKIFLCDGNGAVVTDHSPPKMPPAPVFWTAYLWWQGFGDTDQMGIADLHQPEVRHGQLVRAAESHLYRYLTRRIEERRATLIADWQREGVYPYVGEARTPEEEVERELFDVVAVVASPGIGGDTLNQKLSLRLLKETLQAEPGRVRKVLNAVLSLSDRDQEALTDLLERTELAAVVNTAKTIANRADFLGALQRLLYSDETRRVFREVDQLHPLVVREPWVFGDEWTLTLSESGLTAVVRAAVSQLGKEAEFASTPVRLPSGKTGRVDMVFHRVLPESERNRHLVVELKRPMKVTMTEFGQLNNYATAITTHPEVAPVPDFWDFWLVATEVDPAVLNLATDPSQPGLISTTPRYRLWVVTWAELLDRANRRIAAFRDALQIVSTDESQRSYLSAVHAEFVPAAAVGRADPRNL